MARGFGCLGCGGTTLVLLGALAFGAWQMVVRPAQDFLAGLQAPQTVSQPAAQPGAPLTKADVQKFVQIRRAARKSLGASFTELQKLWVSLQEGQSPSLLQVGLVLRQTAGQLGAARAEQQQLLKQKGMSPQRYAAVRAGVNRALGLPSVDLQRVAEALQKGQLPEWNTSVKPATAQEKALIAPFEAELRASAAAGLLGL